MKWILWLEIVVFKIYNFNKVFKKSSEHVFLDKLKGNIKKKDLFYGPHSH